MNTLSVSVSVCVRVPAEWCVQVLRALSGLILLAQEGEGAEEEEAKTEEEKESGEKGGRATVNTSQLLILISKSMLPMLVWLSFRITI